MATAFVIIMLILAFGGARLFVRKKYDTEPEKRDILKAVKENHNARVRNAEISAKN